MSESCFELSPACCDPGLVFKQAKPGSDYECRRRMQQGICCPLIYLPVSLKFTIIITYTLLKIAPNTITTQLCFIFNSVEINKPSCTNSFYF